MLVAPSVTSSAIVEAESAEADPEHVPEFAAGRRERVYDEVGDAVRSEHGLQGSEHCHEQLPATLRRFASSACEPSARTTGSAMTVT